MVSLSFSCVYRKVSSGEQTREMIGNIVALAKDQPPPSLEDNQTPEKNYSPRGV